MELLFLAFVLVVVAFVAPQFVPGYLARLLPPTEKMDRRPKSCLRLSFSTVFEHPCSGFYMMGL